MTNDQPTGHGAADGIRIEDDGPVIILHNRAERRGAARPDLYEAIVEAVARSGQPDKRALILTGGPYFCAGGDLRRLAEGAEMSDADRRANIEAFHAVPRALHDAAVPVIAAVEGGAAGAGLAIALACDFLISARGAKFTAAYVNAGLTPDGGLTYALARLLPHQLAAEMCLLGGPLAAERLADLGVVTELTEPGGALAAAHALAQRLATGPKQAQSAIRRLLWQARDTDLHGQLDNEAASMARALGGAEAAEGIQAFFEKRPPGYS